MRSIVQACALTVAVTLAGSGCVSRSEGQLGHASFSYASCLFGCSTADNALAAGGAQAEVSVSLAAGYTFSAVRSTNPAVVAASIGGGVGTSIDVVSGAPGTAMLQLLDGNGRLVDQTALTVEPTATLAITRGWSGAAPLVLAHSPQVFHATTTDARGRTTIGTGSVHFTLSGPLTPVSTLFPDGDAIAFSGTPGDGTVSAVAAGSGASATLTVTVVPPSVLTGLAPSLHPNGSDSNGTWANVDVTAYAGSTPVYGASCVWSTSDASVTVRSQTVASLEQAARTSTQLALGRPGSFTATCEIGGRMTTVSLAR